MLTAEEEIVIHRIAAQSIKETWTGPIDDMARLVKLTEDYLKELYKRSYE